MGDFSRVTFTARAALGEGEELLVSGSVQALGGFALSQAIPLKRDAVNKTVWKTVRPVVVPRGVRFRYKYAFRSRHGLRWERLEGDRDFYPAKDSHTICDRIFTTRRHVSNVPLSPPALPTTTASQAKAQANQAPDSQLQSLMGTNKLILVHYSLPILPHLQDDGTWKIEWNEESILARSDQSVADCVTTYWFGLVTANAFDKCNSRQVLRHHGVRFISYTEKERADVNDVPTEQTFDFVNGENFADEIVLLPESLREALVQACLPFNVIPIFLEPHLLHNFLFIFCNLVLFPSFHNVLQLSSQSDFTFIDHTMSMQLWNDYLEATSQFADQILRYFMEGDVIWVHDYQLCVLPKILAMKAFSRPAIVLYLHAPFPTSEIFRALSLRRELLLGMLAADVIGFHTFNHARHFLTSCKRLLGLSFQSAQPGRMGVEAPDGRDVMVAISHVGVEQVWLDKWMASPDAALFAHQFKMRHKNRLIIAGFDGCHRLAGVGLKLLAFERFLEEFPNARDGVVLVQRCELAHAPAADVRRCSEEARELVNRIKAAYGEEVIDYEERVAFSPVYRTGLFHCADVYLQTPIREGLNLLPLQFVYMRTKWLLQRAEMEEASAKEKAEGKSAVPTGRRGSATPTPTPTPSVISSEEDASVSAYDMPAHYRTYSHAPRSRSKGLKTFVSNLFDRLRSIGEESEEPDASLRATDAPPESRGNMAAATQLTPPEHGGVVMLSEFSTSSHVLNSNLTINPWSIREVASELEKALGMGDYERAHRQWRDYEFMIRTPTRAWTERVLVDLLLALRSRGAGQFTEIEPSVALSSSKRLEIGHIGTSTAEFAYLDNDKLCAAFTAAQRRVLFFDFDGTLIKREGTGQYIKHEFMDQSDTALSDKSLAALNEIATLPNTSVFIITGMRTSVLDAVDLAKLENIGLAAENGMAYSWGHDTAAASDTSQRLDATGLKEMDATVKDAQADVILTPTSEESMRRRSSKRKWVCLPLTIATSNFNWEHVRNTAKRIMKKYMHHVNGTFITEYVSMVAWDFRHADPEWAQRQANFLTADLDRKLNQEYIKISLRRTRVEVSLRHINKGALIHSILSVIHDADFVLAIGDDSSDEDMFTTLHSLLTTVEPTPRAEAETPVDMPLSPFVGGAMDEDSDSEHLETETAELVEGEHGTKVSEVNLTARMTRLKRVYSVTVGRKRSNARYFVHDVRDVHTMVERLAKCTGAVVDAPGPIEVSAVHSAVVSTAATANSRQLTQTHTTTA